MDILFGGHPVNLNFAMSTLEPIKRQILEALRHPEAEDGLYFENFFNLYEEEERQIVEADQEILLDAITELLRAGLVEADESGEKVVFRLKKSLS